MNGFLFFRAVSPEGNPPNVYPESKSRGARAVGGRRVAAIPSSQRSGACLVLDLSCSKCLQFRVSVIQHLQRINLFSTTELKEGQLPLCLGWWKTSGKLPTSKDKLSIDPLLLAPLHTQSYLHTQRVLAPPILETFHGSSAPMTVLLTGILYWLPCSGFFS